MQHAAPALFPQGPAASLLVQHDPLRPHTTSSIPPTFILAILCIVIGIPTYLVYQGVLKTTDDSLENKIKQPDDSFSAAAGEKKDKNKNRDGDDPAPPLDLQDLQGLGGLVGLAAIIVMAFALFPEEINTMLGGLAEKTSVTSLFGSTPPVVGPPPIPPDYPAASSPFPPPPDARRPADPLDMSDREYLAEQGILPSWAEDLPEEQWWDTKSAKEIMLTCRIKPWLCDEDDLPIAKRAKPRRRSVPQQTRVIQETVSTSEAILTESPAEVPVVSPSNSVSFLEQHMAVLRSQSILMLPYDEDSVFNPTRSVILLLLIAPLPFLYAYRELLRNAGLVEDKARKEDKKLAKERKHEKDIASRTNAAEVSRTKARKMREEMKELEAVDDCQHGWREEFLKRPWWAPADWKADAKVTAKSKRPWRKPRPGRGGEYNHEDGDLSKPRKTMINARHYKLDFDAELEETNAKRYEADAKRMLEKYPTAENKKERQPFRGMLNPFRENSQGGETIKLAKAEIEERVQLDLEYEESYYKSSSMRKARRKPSAGSKRPDNSLETKWKEMAVKDQEERDQSRWTAKRFMDPEEKRKLRAAKAQWEQAEEVEEERMKSYSGSVSDARAGIESRVKSYPYGRVRHWLQRLMEKEDRTPYEEAYVEVFSQDLQRRQQAAQETAAAKQQAAGAAPGSKPKGFLQKANSLLDKVGKA